MMSELWGLASGVSQRQADDQSQGLFQLSMAEGALKIETQKFALDNAKLMQGRQEQALNLFRLGHPKVTSPNADPTESTADSMYQLGNIELQTGLIEQGSEHIKTAAVLQENHAKILKQQADTSKEKYQLAASLMEDVHDQASWDQMKLIFQSQYNEKLDPKISNQPYSPQLIKMLKDGATTALQKAEIDKDKAQTIEATVKAKADEANIPYFKARAEFEKDRDTNLRKTGAGSVIPKAADVKIASEMIRSEFGKDVSQATADTLARPITEDALRLVRDTGMSQSAAFKTAYNNAKVKGDLDRAKVTPKAAAMTDQVNDLIDDLIASAEKSKGQPLGVTGAGGFINRLKESGENIIGTSSDTKAHDFESKLTELQLLLPKALGTGVAKYKMAEMQRVARGLKAGDTPENTISALQSLKASMTGDKPPAAKPAKPAAAAPSGDAMSLEDYLKLQEAGGRP